MRRAISILALPLLVSAVNPSDWLRHHSGSGGTDYNFDRTDGSQSSDAEAKSTVTMAEETPEQRDVLELLDFSCDVDKSSTKYDFDVRKEESVSSGGIYDTCSNTWLVRKEGVYADTTKTEIRFYESLLTGCIEAERRTVGLKVADPEDKRIEYKADFHRKREYKGYLENTEDVSYEVERRTLIEATTTITRPEYTSEQFATQDCLYAVADPEQEDGYTDFFGDCRYLYHARRCSYSDIRKSCDKSDRLKIKNIVQVYPELSPEYTSIVAPESSVYGNKILLAFDVVNKANNCRMRAVAVELHLPDGVTYDRPDHVKDLPKKNGRTIIFEDADISAKYGRRRLVIVLDIKKDVEDDVIIVAKPKGQKAVKKRFTVRGSRVMRAPVNL